MQGKQKIILISGLAGGISEIIWLFLWSLSSDLHLSKLAHQVTMSVFPFIKDHSFSILLGLKIKQIDTPCFIFVYQLYFCK